MAIKICNFKRKKIHKYWIFVLFKLQIFIAINYRPLYGIRVKIFHLCPRKMLLFPWQAVQRGLGRSQEEVDSVDYTTHLTYQREVLISFKAISPELSYAHCMLTSISHPIILLLFEKNLRKSFKLPEAPATNIRLHCPPEVTLR